MNGPILHLSADFPDRIDPAKTRAIQTLVELVRDRFDQQIVSLNRVAPGPMGAIATLLGGNPIARAQIDGPLTTLAYRAPGRGLWHHGMLRRLADALLDRIAAGPRPGLIMGHKLTVEGLVAAHIAAALGVPYGLTIQGDTDTKILAARPDLRPAFARVFHGASVVFSLAPWSLRAVEARLGARAGQSILLPCPLAADRFIAPRMGGDAIVTAFHLRNARRKNLVRLIAAHQTLRTNRPDVELHILGGGSGHDRARVERMVGAHAGIMLRGAVANAAIPETFNAAIGLALPSLRESFGMVFIEALMAGLPVAYPQGRAIDGYFDGAPFAIAVDPLDTAMIADGMARMMRDEAALKTALARWQTSGEAARFTRAAIADTFAQGLSLAPTHASGSAFTYATNGPAL
ncbi:glycosyltransferase involved in cell wall biosynthesis [Novosphingobium sp. SG751A]|uniref:glycosyltransferase n=1 Tax=Novosphingobium sp. SG751A TaxID=2587000 RepID=UPI001555C749|nr:glycosyltransferase [Novosphingobium sp. SG751A]NOW47697.1 glycosyltransferase involved in cell wall biosynthesis [Novosphingobium sp. SG751A]